MQIPWKSVQGLTCFNFDPPTGWQNMTPQEFELKVRQAVEHALAGKPNEDSLIELKAEWIEGHKAARQIGGHANAARGQEVIWIFGVDERRRRIVPLENLERSNWVSTVQSHFDVQHAPSLLFDRNIVTDEGQVVAMLFDTANAPYVLKGLGDREADRFVPWRRGNATIAAGRGELLRLLVPITRLPLVELYRADASLAVQAAPDGTHEIKFDVEAFIYPTSNDAVSIPAHRCSFECSGEGVLTERLKSVLFIDTADGSSCGRVLHIHRSHLWRFRRTWRLRPPIPELLDFKLELAVVEADFLPVEVRGTLLRCTDHNWNLRQ